MECFTTVALEDIYIRHHPFPEVGQQQQLCSNPGYSNSGSVQIRVSRTLPTDEEPQSPDFIAAAASSFSHSFRAAEQLRFILSDGEIRSTTGRQLR